MSSCVSSTLPISPCTLNTGLTSAQTAMPASLVLSELVRYKFVPP